MDFSVGQFIATIVGGLFVAGLIAFFKRRRVHLYIPRLFPHSSLSDAGSIVEFNLANKGFLSEEEIQISLKPRLRYQLVATTLSAVTLKENVVGIPRLLPRQEVSVVLLVEGGEFSEGDIAAATSKQAVVRILKGPQPPPPASAQLALALFILVVLMFMPAYFASEVSVDLGRNAISAVFDIFRKTTTEKRVAFEKDGWTELSRFFEIGGLHSYYEVGRFPLENVVVKRKGRLIVITADAVNMTPGFVEFTIGASLLETGGTMEYGKERDSWTATVAAKGVGKAQFELDPRGDRSTKKVLLSVYMRGESGWATIRKVITF